MNLVILFCTVALSTFGGACLAFELQAKRLRELFKDFPEVIA